MTTKHGHRKAAFQLSLGFIIAVVFAIILLTLSITWLQNMFSGIVDITETLRQEASIKLEETFQQTDDDYAIWPPEYQTGPGTKISVTAGIKNDAMDGKSHKYAVNTLVEVVPQGVSNDYVKSWITWIKSPKSITANSYDKIPIDITIPDGAKKGTYMFRIVACADIMSDPPHASTSVSADSCLADSNNIWGSSAKDFILRIE